MNSFGPKMSLKMSSLKVVDTEPTIDWLFVLHFIVEYLLFFKNEVRWFQIEFFKFSIIEE
jgi:hypothetical protein